MRRATETRLVRAALRARRNAVAPYSGFPVGAALLTAEGAVVTGANIESASYGLSCCAERVALFNALSQGHRRFLAMAVVAAHPGGPLPCGACRQLLAEHAPQAVVLVADARRPAVVRRFTVAGLLPAPFREFERSPAPPPARGRRRKKTGH